MNRHWQKAASVMGNCRVSERISIARYYDDLTPHYKLMFHDWESSVQRHADILDGIIREYAGEGAHTVLDAACGIGTQSLGLVQRGYQVNASDISPAEIALAREEAAGRGLSIDFHVGDMRQVWTSLQRQFDVVLALDNAVPHLLSDEDILRAFRQFYQCTAPGGLCIISVRDYAAMERSGQRIFPRLVHDTPTGRDLLFDLWQFDGDYYDFTTYIVHDTGKPEAVSRIIRGGRYYCVSVEMLARLFYEAGFTEVIIDRERFYQPVLIARGSSE